MNKLNDPQKTAKIMSEFEKQNMKMNMTDEMSKWSIYSTSLFRLLTTIGG